MPNSSSYIGIHVHTDFGSRFLSDELSHLGCRVSYDDVQKYIYSSVMDESNQMVEPLDHFTQWIADNVDHTIATIDGHNITHLKWR